MSNKGSHDRIFGKPERHGSGKHRKCKVCGGWHPLDKPWPHNCRSEAPRRNISLAAPLLAPAFEPFRTNGLDPEVISSRNDKREYMEKHDLAEYDSGVASRTGQWARDLEETRERKELISELYETDSEYLPKPIDMRDSDLKTGGHDVDLDIADNLPQTP